MNEKDFFTHKTVRTDVDSIYTHLTQPTDLAADWAGIDYTKPIFSRPGGIPSGRFHLALPESQEERQILGGTMLTQVHPQIITRNRVVNALANIRQEWGQAANGESLIEVKGSVGLLLADLVMAIDLNPAEQVEVLGADLVEELQGILTATTSGNGHHE